MSFRNCNKQLIFLIGTMLIMMIPISSQAESLRVVGIASGNKVQASIERPFYKKLAKKMNFSLAYNSRDALNIKAASELRLVQSGAFDIASIQLGMAAQDDPIIQGVDLAGVSPTLSTQKKVADAYRPVLEKTLKKRFHVKLLALWPFGPQNFYCNGASKSAINFSGKKVRVFTSSMAQLIGKLNGSPVTIQFGEVYPALQRHVISCAITAPAAGNTAKWPEVTNHFIPLSVSNAMQMHVMNLDKWNSLTVAQKHTIKEGFNKLQHKLWSVAENLNKTATQCNVGNANYCNKNNDNKLFTLYHMKIVKVTDADRKAVQKASETSVIPSWIHSCSKVDPNCAEIWNRTVGKVVGLTAKNK